MPATRTRSSSSTFSRPSTKAPSSTSLTRAVPRPLSLPTVGWACMSAQTLRSRTRSPGRSSTPALLARTSSGERRRVTTSMPRPSSSGHSNAEAKSPAFLPTRSANSPMRTRRLMRRSCAGHSASPNITMASTTCSASAIWRSSPGRSVDTVPGCPPCEVRTTCRAVATWARYPTSSRASKTSPTTMPERNSTPSGA